MRRSRGWWKQRLINWVARLVTVAMGRVERVVAIAIDEKERRVFDTRAVEK